MADVGLSPPAQPLTSDEMQHVAFAAKMAVLKCLRTRKRKPPSPQSDPKGVDRG
jgi:hypothetical protein